MTGKYVDTPTSVTTTAIICVVICAPSMRETPAAHAMTPPCIVVYTQDILLEVLSSAAHHKTITAALLQEIGMVLFFLAARAAHLPASLKSVNTRCKVASQQGVTTPTDTADY